MARPADPDLRARRRADLVDAAAQLFGSRGFEATTVADIARLAGMSPATVFTYVPDKAALFRAIFEGDLPRAAEQLAAAEAAPEPLAALLDLLDDLAADAQDPVAQGLVFELLRRVTHDPELLALVEQVDAGQRRAIRLLVERAGRAGRIDPGLDADTAAAWLQTVVDGIYLDHPGGTDPRPVLRELTRRFLRAEPESS